VQGASLSSTEAKNLRVEWNAENAAARIQTLRLAAIPSPVLNFAQVLVRFESHQTLQVLDNKQHTIAGSKNQKAVCEYLVLERALQDVGLSRWRFLGRGAQTA
jgi:hypothetical protein